MSPSVKYTNDRKTNLAPKRCKGVSLNTKRVAETSTSTKLRGVNKKRDDAIHFAITGNVKKRPSASGNIRNNKKRNDKNNNDDSSVDAKNNNPECNGGTPRRKCKIKDDSKGKSTKGIGFECGGEAPDNNDNNCNCNCNNCNCNGNINPCSHNGNDDGCNCNGNGNDYNSDVNGNNNYNCYDNGNCACSCCNGNNNNKKTTSNNNKTTSSSSNNNKTTSSSSNNNKTTSSSNNNNSSSSNNNNDNNCGGYGNCGGCNCGGCDCNYDDSNKNIGANNAGNNYGRNSNGKDNCGCTCRWDEPMDMQEMDNNDSNMSWNENGKSGSLYAPNMKKSAVNGKPKSKQMLMAYREKIFSLVIQALRHNNGGKGSSFTEIRRYVKQSPYADDDDNELCEIVKESLRRGITIGFLRQRKTDNKFYLRQKRSPPRQQQNDTDSKSSKKSACKSTTKRTANGTATSRARTEYSNVCRAQCLAAPTGNRFKCNCTDKIGVKYNRQVLSGPKCGDGQMRTRMNTDQKKNPTPLPR